jgi:hypothetical protein
MVVPEPESLFCRVGIGWARDPLRHVGALRDLVVGGQRDSTKRRSRRSVPSLRFGSGAAGDDEGRDSAQPGESEHTRRGGQRDVIRIMNAGASGVDTHLLIVVEGCLTACGWRRRSAADQRQRRNARRRSVHSRLPAEWRAGSRRERGPGAHVQRPARPRARALHAQAVVGTRQPVARGRHRSRIRESRPRAGPRASDSASKLTVLTAHVQGASSGPSQDRSAKSGSDRIRFP